ncbi:29667_t:CDS:2, partial [Racocetra persica]
KAYSYLPQDFLSSLDLIVQSNIEKTGSLGHYNFTVQEALDFRAMSGGLINLIVTGSEQFPGYFIGPFYEITLSIKMTKFLVQYYSNIYPNYSFHSENQKPNLKQSILVSSTARRAKALKLEDEIYYHFLVIVDWYKRDPQKQSYFYVKSNDDILSTNADRSYHAELWEDRFIE